MLGWHWERGVLPSLERQPDRWLVKAGLKCCGREGLLRLQPQHQLPTGTTDGTWVSSSGRAVPKDAAAAAADSTIHAVTKEETHANQAWEMPRHSWVMQRNTPGICGIGSLGWVSEAGWSQAPGQLIGLHLVPGAMPRERKTWRGGGQESK